jgi:hypothetical protein
MSKTKLNEELEADNKALRQAITKYDLWIRSISEHYAEVQIQLLHLNKSIVEVQTDFLNYFKAKEKQQKGAANE